jgi:hypothetical protein
MSPTNPASPGGKRCAGAVVGGRVTAARQACSRLIAAATPALTSPHKERHSATPNTCRAHESDDAPKFLPERRAGWAEVNAFGDRCGSRRIIAVIADRPILDASVARGGWHMRDALVQSRRAGAGSRRIGRTGGSARFQARSQPRPVATSVATLLGGIAFCQPKCSRGPAGGWQRGVAGRANSKSLTPHPEVSRPWHWTRRRRRKWDMQLYD